VLRDVSEQQELSKEEKQYLAHKGWENPVWFCRWFLEDLFPTPMPWLHRGVLAILLRRCDFLQSDPELATIIKNFYWREDPHEENDDPAKRHYIFHLDDHGLLYMDLERFTVMMMPRGFSKTTLAGVAVPLINILYQENPFTAYISEANPHAKMQLGNVRYQLSDNRRIRAVFGDLRPNMSDDEKWSEDFFETTTGMAMVARGSGGQIRGLNHKGNRPKHIVGDDLEDQESVATEAQREKMRAWFYADVLNALPEADISSSITVLGTLLHSDSLLNTLMNDPEWTVIRMEALDVDEKPVWPLVMDDAKLARRKQSLAAAGLLHVYFMEFHNRVIAAETQIIKKEHWIYEVPVMADFVGKALYMDPAISEKRTADSTVIACVGITKKGVIWILDLWGKRTSDEMEKVNAFFAMSKRWGVPTFGEHHGIESNAYQAAVANRVREEMFRQKHYFELKSVTNKSKKISRIKMGLAQPLVAGYVRCARRFFDLEIEAAEFREDGSHKHDDYLDATAGAIDLVSAEHASAAAAVDPTADIYPPLEEELGGEWRWA
jgi:hypothetical protein